MAKFSIHYDTDSDSGDEPAGLARNTRSPGSSHRTMIAEHPIQADPEGQAPVKENNQTPLPVRQLFIICIVSLAEPIAFTQIFPYINHMVKELHVTDDPSEIGFYSGLVDSLFAFSQFFTVYQWGKLSDRIGRRPVISAGLLGVALASSLFGLSSSFAGMLIARALAGMLSGNIAVMKTVIGEITDKTNQARAFPLPFLAWSFGAVIGPMLGGSLSHPAEQYPEIFGHCQFLKDKPFFLPSFVSSCITVLCFFLSYFFLEETLPRLVTPKAPQNLRGSKRPLLAQSCTTVSSTSTSTVAAGYGTIKPASSVHSEATATEPAPIRSVPTVWALLSDKKVFAVLCSTFFLSFLSISWNVVFVLFAYTPVELGGLSKEPTEIGYALTGFGIFGVFAMLFIFPFLHDRFGSLTLYNVLMQLWPLSFAIMPILNWTARYYELGDIGKTDGHTGPSAREGNAVVWIGIATAMVIAKAANMAWSANSIVVSIASHDQATLGAMFGLAQSASNIARSIGPAFVSSLFAISVERQTFGGNLVWIVMCGLSFLGVWNSRYLVHANRSSERDEARPSQAGAQG